ARRRQSLSLTQSVPAGKPGTPEGMPSTRTARALESRRPALIRPSQRRCAGADCTGDRLLGLHIYTSRPCPEMRAHAADRVFRIVVVLASRLSCPLHWGPSPLAAKLVAGHGAGDEREPGRDARMP